MKVQKVTDRMGNQVALLFTATISRGAVQEPMAVTLLGGVILPIALVGVLLVLTL